MRNSEKKIINITNYMHTYNIGSWDVVHNIVEECKKETTATPSVVSPNVDMQESS